MPRPVLPNNLQFNNVPVGSRPGRVAGVYARSDNPNVMAQIEGDTAGVFRVTRVETDDVVSDPDSPPGKPPLLVLQTALVVQGPGPVPVDAGQAILATVEFNCPADPTQDVYTGSLVFEGLSRRFGIVATVNAKLTCDVQIDSAHTFLALGDTQQFPFVISSTLGHDVNVVLQHDATFAPQFASLPVAVHVPRAGSASGTLSLTNVGARSVVNGSYSVRFVAAETDGHHSATQGATLFAGVHTTATAHTDVLLNLAAADINRFYAESGGLLTVGLPTGPVVRDPNGSYHLPCTMGSMIKLDGEPTQVESRVLIDKIEIVGCRCFSPDDPGGDETYLVSNVYWIDPSRGPQVQSMRTPIADDNSVKDHSVIMQGVQLNSGAIEMPGEEDIRMHIDLWDHEHGDADDIKNKASEVAQDVLAATAGAVGALLAGVGAGFAAAVVSKVSGLLAPVGDAIGGLVASIFDDDRIDSKDFLITGDYIRRLLSMTPGAPPVLERTSASLLDSNLTYNFPEKVENDSDEGKSWLFDGGTGGGQYRIFFRITARTIGPPVA